VKHLFTGLYSAFSSMLTRLRSEDGQTMAEYGILIGVIAVVVVVAAILLGTNITSIFNSASSHL
jgi:pilus assembly protein Flp/PilA